MINISYKRIFTQISFVICNERFVFVDTVLIDEFLMHNECLLKHPF